ncbi:MAG: LysE family translocator [Mitsuaria chitosanitabida]|jgi:threonine/homoserine/homoserine lactone efflux protein|uniref:LysE family translocator n=1 Tax=Roseateles chitosanitabidus TaxID=65048 RepID=UPI001B155694|nr:LysE family translocator [Roseateles chitosanitabidus]MBO9687365.1 LysE family translocator [Roseateles chitosanitabidus]
MTPAELSLYFALVLGIVLIPGMDMAFVVGHSLTGGLRAGLAALGGVVAGALCHLTMGAMGLALVLKALPGAFTAMLVAGALYLAWLGWGLMRAEPTSTAATGTPQAGRTRSAFFGAMLTNLLNPKAYLFSLAVLPQFVHPERGGLVLQLGVIALITAATQIAIYGGLAWVAAGGRGRMAGSGAAGLRRQRLLLRGVGLLLWITAIYTGWQAWVQAAA